MRPRSKNWGKNQNLNYRPLRLVFVTIRFVFKKQTFIKKEGQNWTKNDQVMPNLMFLCQSGIWPILCQFMAILAKLLDMDFKFVLPSIYINFDMHTNFEVNQTQISHSISKNTPKTHQSCHISKPHFAQVSFTKKPTPPTFFNEFF